MQFAELDGDQRRQLIDVEHVFTTYRSARKAARGHYRWRVQRGQEYLMRKLGGHERSLGRRSPETEAAMAEHQRARETCRRTKARLAEMARVNRALRLNRLPTTAARVLRELDAADLLGQHLFVIGTNALYAYEAASGVLCDSATIATMDFDLLWDAHDRLRLAVLEASPDGVLGLLRKADASFTSGDDYGFRARNADGYFVDLFCPDVEPTLGRKSPADIDPTPAAGLDWLTDSPLVDRMVIGHDGLPARMACVDPRVFALHKAWLSRREDRQPLSRPRDMAQAQFAVTVARDFLMLKMDERFMRHLPPELAQASALLDRFQAVTSRNS